MKKMQLLMLITAGVFSFAASFTVSWYLKKNQPVVPQDSTQASEDGQKPAASSASLLPMPKSLQAAESDSFSEDMSERQLQNLIQDIRGRIQEYRNREKELESESERIQLAHQSLQEEIDRLNQLRSKITILTHTLDEKEKLLKESVLEIQTVEKNNFQRLAATYDKMEATQASQILGTMASSAQAPDAIKILYYMSERTAAKVLGEIGRTQPDLVVLINTKLKRVQENG